MKCAAGEGGDGVRIGREWFQDTSRNVLKERDEPDDRRYVMFRSPHNGIGVKTSVDAVRWTDEGPLLTLGQAEWPWASGRITAGAVLDCRKVPGVGKYLMFFHGSSPIDFAPASLGLAWSDDLRSWSWPGAHAN